MYAIAASGGKQFRIEKNLTIRVPLLKAEVGEKVRLDQILLYSDGSKVDLGAPYLDGAFARGHTTRPGNAQGTPRASANRCRDQKIHGTRRAPSTGCVPDGPGFCQQPPVFNLDADWRNQHGAAQEQHRLDQYGITRRGTQRDCRHSAGVPDAVLKGR